MFLVWLLLKKTIGFYTRQASSVQPPLYLNNTGNEILVLQIISQVIMIFFGLGLIKISLGKHALQEEVLNEQLIYNSPQLVNKERPCLSSA